MVKLVQRGGKMVLPRPKVDYDKKLATTKLRSLFGSKVHKIKFTPIRRDGTRGVRYELKWGTPYAMKGSYSYLTDIKRG